MKTESESQAERVTGCWTPPANTQRETKRGSQCQSQRMSDVTPRPHPKVTVTF